MRINTQFPVAAHILVLVGLWQHLYNEMPTSAVIAASVNTNPVVIRRINASLKAAGLVNVRPGIGGVELLKNPREISLKEIFHAVKSPESPSIFNLHQKVNPKCKVGSVINSVLTKPLNAAQQTLEMSLGNYTLFDIMTEIAKENSIKLE